MSRAPISRSPDLQRLRDLGYGVEVVEGALVIHPVPFLDAHGTVRAGAVLSELDLAGDTTAKPRSHVAFFAGGTPHDATGHPLTSILNSNHTARMGGMNTTHRLSTKPGPGGYANYFDKMHTYVAAIAGHAEAVDPTATARTFPVTAADEEGPFVYDDTASARVEVDTNVFRDLSIGIVGLGGTGAYVLDQVAKTPVATIHLYDGDTLLQHNAYRAPGAVPMPILQASPLKAEHWATTYGAMHRGIVAHTIPIDEASVHLLADHDFVFVCIDDNDTRTLIFRALHGAEIPYIDTGLGVYRVGTQLAGILRTTLVTPEKHDHVNDRLPAGRSGADDEYGSNIQIADLNMLNAAFAVMRWKRTLGFYFDQENEHTSNYSIAGNALINEDQT